MALGDSFSGSGPYLKGDVPTASPGGLFVVTLGEVRCYSGVLLPLRGMWSSQLPVFQRVILQSSRHHPVRMHDMEVFGSGILEIDLGWSSSGPGQPLALPGGRLPSDVPNERDPRADSRIRRALTRHGQFSAGLELTLDNVTLSQAATSATCTYTYTIRNRDRDALFVLDPDRVGATGFQLFTRGPVFTNGPFEYHVPSRRPPAAFLSRAKAKPDAAWLTLLRSGELMTRTVVRTGYAPLEPGTYACDFACPSPRAVPRAERTLPGGRLWLGNLRARATLVVPPR